MGWNKMGNCAVAESSEITGQRIVERVLHDYNGMHGGRNICERKRSVASDGYAMEWGDLESAGSASTDWGKGRTLRSVLYSSYGLHCNRFLHK